MKTQEPSTEPSTEHETLAGGFGAVDEKGRVTLSRAARNALGIYPGSSVAYLVLDHALLLIPQDQHLAQLMESAAQTLSAAGLTVQDFLDDLPAARAEVVEEAYGKEFMLKLEEQQRALRSSSQSDE